MRQAPGMTSAFMPGREVEGETVCRTFQPSFAVLGDGTVLAFCQGRLGGGADDDPKVVLCAKSEDRGATWSPARVVSGRMMHYALSAFVAARNGRECVSVLTMVDLRGTEKIYGLDFAQMRESAGLDIETIGRQTPMVLCRFDSDDGGDTWKTETLSGAESPLNREYPEGTLVMFNPVGQVHAVPAGPCRGRLVIAGPVTVVPPGEEVTDWFRNHPQSGSGIILSEDLGKTWSAGGMVNDYLGNEASCVSLGDGTRLFMIRRVNRLDRVEKPPLSGLRPGPGERLAHTSADGGLTWSEPFTVPVSGATCHGTLARDGDLLLFSIPDGPGRQKGAVYASGDEGRTWKGRTVEPGSFSYSTVGRIAESEYMVLYARGAMGDQGIGCRVFDADWPAR